MAKTEKQKNGKSMTNGTTKKSRDKNTRLNVYSCLCVFSLNPLNCGMMGNTLWPPDLQTQITFATHATSVGKHTGTIYTTVTVCIIHLESKAIKTILFFFKGSMI